ncbi:hypothetical protein FHJ30_17650 [Arthrobacter sp. BB-1]|uniref:hypothetical protein n=1 Tax=unclassified Arthrobacter TaxID=235627 RepID=UPI0011123DDC|nr:MULTISPECIES: hypothetical protein [unclassified Arthrobacter]TNB69766.1 hypothetical protein FHJ30_17650 [Arthrobacter sp. BB-1]
MAKTLLILAAATALSILLRVLLPEDIGVVASAIIGLAFVAYLVVIAFLHRKKSAPPPQN